MGIEAINNYINPAMFYNSYSSPVNSTPITSVFGNTFSFSSIANSFSTNSYSPTFNYTPSFSCSGFFSGLWGSLKNFGHKSMGKVRTFCHKIGSSAKELLNNANFMNKVIQISKNIGCDFRDLLGVMRAESGMNSAAQNKKSKATGLIQFMPSTARGLGTNTEALRNMSAVQQLDYVEKYLLKTKRSAGFKSNEKLSAGQLYALVFLPARAKREVLTTSNEKFYKWNSGTDINKDGKITRAEMDERAKRFNVDKYIPKQYLA